MARIMRSILGRNSQPNWYDPESARAGMDTPLKRVPGSANFYGSYSDGEVQPTATDRGNLVRPNMPPLRDTAVSRFVQKATFGEDSPVKTMSKPSRKDRKQYKQNLKTYEANKKQSMDVEAIDYNHPDGPYF